VQAQVAQTGSRTALRQLLATGGVPAVYRSLLPTAGRIIPGAAIWFAAQEKCTSLGASPFVAGGMGGVAEWLVVMPVDTVKTVVTVAPRGTSVHAVAAGIFKESGVRGFYRGDDSNLLFHSTGNVKWILRFP
jgi:hypothetical protein